MTSPTVRVARGLLLLAIVFVAAVCGYRYFHGLDWLEATWFVTVSISGVGYGEESIRPPSFQLFTIVVIGFGFVATAYAITGLAQLLLAGEIERFLGRRRMEREINKLDRHIVVCGFGRLGQSLVADLAEETKQLLLIENDPHRLQVAESEGCLVIDGDATEEEVLRMARLDKAKSLVTTLPSDAANVFITLTARDLNPNLQIIARAELPSTERKLQHAGASKVVMPSATSARHMLRMITRPSTAHLIDLMAERSFLDFEMDEVLIPPTSDLVGVTVARSQLNFRHKLLVVAVKQSDDTMVFNPSAEYAFRDHDIAIVMGKRGDIRSFCETHGLSR